MAQQITELDRRSVAAMLAGALGLSVAGCGRGGERLDPRALEALADAIIPETDTPGALAAGVPRVITELHDGWASAATQERLRNGLASALEALGPDFRALPSAERSARLAPVDETAYRGAPEWADYRLLKELIVQAFYLSEVGATQELQYEHTPGEWRASAPLAEIGRTWAV